MGKISFEGNFVAFGIEDAPLDFDALKGALVDADAGAAGGFLEGKSLFWRYAVQSAGFPFWTEQRHP